MPRSTLFLSKGYLHFMKSIIAIAFAMLPYFAWAQFASGQLFLGGSLSASTATTTNNSPASYKQVTNQFSVTPSIGFFLNPKISIGSGIGYSASYQKDIYSSSSQKNNNHYYYLSPFARYYFTVTGSFFIVLQGQINLSRGTTTAFSPLLGEVTTTPSYNLGATISPIFIFFPSPKWGIEAGIGSIGYNYTRNLPDVSSTGTFSLNSGTFSLGLAYYFKRKE
jgi:hypothetical protein